MKNQIYNSLSPQTHSLSSGVRLMKLSNFALAAMLCLGYAGGAFAQAANPADQANQGQDDIVVTGSRVASNGFGSPAPLTVLGAEDLSKDAPINIANTVNKLPQFSGSATSQNTSNSVSDGNAGVNNVNLRALGANRTLVLLDGVRIVPSSVSGFYNNGGSVDTNPFPDGLIKRVDVVTAGASAVYGSDAISGVVNFILDKTFTGVKASVLGGVSNKGDNATYRVSLAAGTGFADDRGHILLSGSYTHNDGILSGTSRNWMMNNVFVPITNPNYTATNGQPFILVSKGSSSQYTPGGLIVSGPLRGIDFGPGGATRMFNFGSPNDGSYMAGGDGLETITTAGNYLRPSNSVDPAVTRKNIFARLSYDITDNVQLYGQFMFATTDTFTVGGSQIATNFTIQSGNPFIPASVQQQMTAQGLSSITMSKEVSSEIGLSQVYSNKKFYQYLGGATGDFDALGTNWTWDAYVTQSISRNVISIPNNIVRPYFTLATDVVLNSQGVPVCRSTLTTPNNGCVPFNPFGTGVNGTIANNYITDLSYLNQKLSQTEESATIRGEPFSTWAGPVSMAFGLEHRSQSVTGRTTALDTATSFGVGNFKATFGSVKATEGFFETLVPLARDVAWAKELSLNGAVRLTDYSTSGRVTTWKVGGTYSPFSDLMFRATRSRDIRAPNLGELYSAGQAGASFIRDPFRNNVTTSYTNIRIGNPNLTPEMSDSTSVGAVYRPSWLPGFNVSVDYYNIKIKDAINTTSLQDIVDSCYAGNQTFCSFIERDSSGAISIVYQRPANTALLHANGLDIEMGYRRPLLDGTLSIRGFASHAFHLTRQQSNGTMVEGAGVNFGNVLITPDWTYNISVGYDSDKFSVSWTGRGFSDGVLSNEYIGCTANCPTSTAARTTISDNSAPGQFLMDVHLAYRLKLGGSVPVETFVHIDNIANSYPKDLHRIGFYPGNHDFLGRSFRAGLNFKL